MKIEVPTLTDVNLQNWVQQVSDALNWLITVKRTGILLSKYDEEVIGEYINVTEDRVITTPYEYIKKIINRTTRCIIETDSDGICSAHSSNPNILTIIDGLIEGGVLYAFDAENVDETDYTWSFPVNFGTTRIMQRDGVDFESPGSWTLYLSPYYDPAGAKVKGVGKINNCFVYEYIGNENE